MSDFKPITTQEDFDKAVQSRLAREQETISRKYADYDEIKERNEDLTNQINALNLTLEESSNTVKAHEETVAELNSKINGYETSNMRTKVALQNGLSLEFAERLIGDDEESLIADAKRMAGLVNKNQTPPPLKNTEPVIEDSENAPYQSLLKNINFEGE